MKRIFTLFLLTLLSGFGAWSQTHVNYDRDTRWFIGINGGGTFHTQTETPVLYRGGYGFTVGGSIGMDPKKMFSWDIRGRFLHAFFGGQGTSPYNLDSSSTAGLYNYGTNLTPYQDSIGYFVPNFRTTAARFSLELVLNTNRLRERTGWNFSLFGGFGVTGYHVKSDLFQDDFFSNSIYDYNTAGSLSKSNLLSFQDNDFETDIVGTDSDFEWDWMPSFGAGISYQLSPAVAIGFEHKMTWTRTDWFDGMPNTYAGVASPSNDIYHYTSLGFKFHLFHGTGSVTTHTDVTNFDTQTDQNQIVQQPVQKPIIEIYDPGSSPHTTTWNQFTVKAKIYHVDNKSKVTFKQNGIVNNNFTYDPYSDEFSSVVVLQPGQNLFEISAFNNAGSDYETTVIIYELATPVKAPPIVTITNPPYSPFNTLDQVFNMTSTVLNVDSKSQIQVYFNGNYVSGFGYNGSTNVVNSTLSLQEGSNTVTVTATNDAGSDSKTATIIYTKPSIPQPPVVTYTNPSVNPYTHNSSNINVIATVLNVASQADITVKVNGTPTSAFTYNVSTKQMSLNTNLSEGANIIETKAVNAAGMDIETTTILYLKPAAAKPPVVTFIDPVSNPITVFTSHYNVVAKVEHVSGPSAITLKINGVVSTSFAYSNSSKLMTFSTGLVEGANVIEIKGVNEVGQDIKSTTIIYKRTIPQAPPIVTITYPATDNVVFSNPDILLSSTVLNVANASNIQVLVNGNATNSFNFNTATKVLTLPLMLNEGVNTIKITGTNSAGSDSKTRLIIYKKPTVPTPPTVVFVNPSTSPHISPSQAYTVMANTTNISSKSQIEFKMNGVVIPDANYTLNSSNQIIYNANLLSGNNIFEVFVSNMFGADEALALVSYTAPVVPCIIPTVGYISPVPYSTVTEANVTIDAQINNHSSGTTVELKINGVSQGYMTYNSSSSIASKTATLNEGSNAISVIVTNDCGTNMATFTLNYVLPNPPCNQPTVYANGSTSIVTQASQINLSAGATYVPASTNITTTLNGNPVSFDYDLGSGNITLTNLPLVIGNNSVLITVSNPCGVAVITYNIVREPCLTPAITSILPANGTNTTETSVNFTANVMHAASTEITLLVNGISHAFDFNNSTHILSAPINLNVGSNTITLQVATNCGNASQNITLNREIPCAPITHSFISPSTQSATVTSENYAILLHTTGVSSPSQINVTLNGAVVPFNFDAVTGNVSMDNLTLTNGMNTVVVAMNNACSSPSITYSIQYNGCIPPSINFGAPANGSNVSSATVPLSATVLNANGASNIVLLLNGVSVGFDYNEVSGLLSGSLNLNEGANTITLQVNGCETASQTLTVNYVVPCQDVVLVPINPAGNSITVTENSFTISLSAQNVSLPSQINVTLNGNTIPVNFNSSTGVLSISGSSLNEGNNTLTVSATNNCSSANQNYTITYNGCQPPVITLAASSSASSVSLYSFTATVTNISNQSAINVLLNGAPVPFVFNAATGQINSEFTLTEGSNTIVVTANGCETASQTAMVTYTVPCEPITFALGTPATNIVSVSDATYSIQLFAHNVSSPSITVQLNGSAVPFTFTGDIITINNLTLVSGTNTIQVNLVNGCSSESISYTVNYNDAVCGTRVNPGNSEWEFCLVTPSGTFTRDNLHSNPYFTYSGPATSLYCKPIAGGGDAFLDGSPYSLVNGQYYLFTGNLNVTVSNDNPGAMGHWMVCIQADNEPVHGNGANRPASPCEAPPCIAPVITFNSSANSTSANYSLNATVTQINNAGNIVVTLNGSPVSVSFNPTTGILTGTLNLLEGNNVISITADGCENISNQLNVTYTIPCVPPVITLSSPVSSNTDAYLLTGTITNITDPSQIILTLNGSTVTPIYNAATDGLMANLTLTPGNNTIVVTANGCASANQTLIVQYDVPCDPPVIGFTSAATATESTYVLTGNVSNISSPSDIIVQHNGSTVAATYNATIGAFSATLTLSEGANTILVQANGCNTVNQSLNVVYSLPVQNCLPNVSATFAPDHKSATANSSMDLSNVVLKFEDGTTQKFEGLSGYSGTFSGTGVHEGKCIVGVWIKSGCNQSNDGPGFGEFVANTSWTGTCGSITPPCNAPLITFGSATASSTNTYSLNATITHITNPANIIVTLNGAAVVAAFNTSSGVLSGNLNLVEGNNTIVVTANECESVSGELTVVYTAPCNPPVITLTSATSTTTATYNLAATVTNISNPSAITVTFNGAPVSASYATGSGILTANLTLVEGNNTLVVQANGCSVANQTFTINYEAANACGTRINPGNSQWEFCLVTPGGTYTRDNLHSNPNFTYSGAASSLYCKPIAGGGDAYLNGQALPLTNGQYYLFTGNLNVSVSNDNPGAMGHWVVCIQTDTEPTSGNGANRPASPCEAAPCNPPVITFSSGTSTSAASYALGATVTNIENPSAITVTVNGQSVAAAYNITSDQLTANLNLTVGNNTIVIQANGCSAVNKTLTVNYTATPVDDNIDFDIQGNGTVTVNETACATITCLGESVVYNNSQEAYVKIQYSLNGGSTWHGFANEQNVAGGESSSVNMPSGSNLVIKAVCTNQLQNWSNTLTSNSGSQWVHVLKNGDIAPTYSPATGQLPLDAFLSGYINSSGVVTIGPNDVIYLYELRHVGSVGIDYQDVVMLVTFNDNPNCPPPTPLKMAGQPTGEIYKAPVITPMQPATSPIEVTNPQYAFKVRVDHINAAEDIVVSINGVATPGFTYNFTNKELSGNLTLAGGSTVIGVKATNGDKTVNASYTINYKAKEISTPVNNVQVTPTPVIDMIAPAGSVENVSTSTYMLKAKISNVQSKANIRVTVNGTSFAGFTYSTSSQELTAVLSLRTGANLVKIEATNGDKTATATYTITYTLPQKEIKPDPNNNGGTTKPVNTGGGTTTPVNNGGTTKPVNTGGGTTTPVNNGGTTKTENTGGTTTTPVNNNSTTTPIKTGGGTTTTPVKTEGGTTTPTKTEGGTTTPVKTTGTTTPAKTEGGTTTPVKTGGGTNTPARGGGND